MTARRDQVDRAKAGVMQFLRRLSRFLRLAAAGATVAIPLLGAVTSASELPLMTMFGLAAVGLTHHVFSFVLNDVVDLSIDRTEPRRARSPLVQGLISPRFALVVSLLAVPLVLWLSDLIGASTREQGLLVSSLLLIAAYDVWGKRAPVPPVTDAVQGVGWSLLAWYGAEIAGGATVVTACFCVFLIGYITLANGVHGGLRDLQNDRSHGARTTALYFGATPLEDGEAVAPAALRRYALSLETFNSIVAWSMIVAIGYRGWALALDLVGWASIAGASVLLLLRAFEATSNRQQMMIRGTGHLITSFAVVLVVLLPQAPPGIAAFVLFVYVAPLLTYGWLFDALSRVPEPRSAR